MNRFRRTSFLRRWACALGLALLGVGTGCSGGQTGGESPVAGECQVAYEELALDAPTPLGVSAASVLAPVLGANTAPLLWSTDTGALTVGPEQGSSEIELIAAYVGGRVAWARFGQDPGDSADDGVGEDTTAAAPIGSLGCAVDRLEVELDIRLRTAGGALDEHFVATLGAPTADDVGLTYNLPPSEQMGSLFVIAPEGVSAAFVNITAVWDVFGFRGTLRGGVEMTSRDPSVSGGAGGSVGFGFVPYAEWPPPPDDGRR